MNALDQISQYLGRLERGLRWLTVSRGAALLGGVALGVTLALVMLLNQLSFSAPALLWARIALFLGIACALAAGVVIPLLAVNRRRGARAAEAKFPAFGDRLLTFTERQSAHPDDPFLPLLAEDALPIAGSAAPHEIASPARAAGFASVAATACAVLLWLAISGPGFLGYGTSLLWGGNPKAERKPFRAILVQPGDATLRRRMDQPIFAKLQGFDSGNAAVFARYASSTKWEQAAMQHQANGPAFEFIFASLPENVEYYVESNGVRSSTYTLSVSDLPAIKKLVVTYHFPAYYGMKDAIENPGGDLRAVEGTIAEVQVETDKPLAAASLVLDSGESIPLSGAPLRARVPIQKDGMYHVAARDHGSIVRLSEDYFIEARRDAPPTISIVKPGHDAKVTPVEEVPVKIQARDDFGLQSVELHYSVNGGPEKVQAVLAAKGAKTSDGSVTLAMEDFHVVPGDLVSLYATAKDARSTSKTEILFVEAKPFEFNYSQSQQEGASGAGGDAAEKISERQKEIIAATFNEMREGSDKNKTRENATYLADVQSKLRDQAKSLVERVNSRQLASSDGAMQSFVQNIQSALQQMEPAAEQLRGARWQTALSPEQKALQYLLRAEANFRDIQISMSRGQGSGGQGGSRDMENLSELELDTKKNQYETGRQSAQDDQQKKIDDTMARLKELAKRQQQLAEQQKQAQNFQQRWEQEMLRREAEQLRREMEQMARDQQQGQSSLPAQPSQSKSQSGGSQSSSASGAKPEDSSSAEQRKQQEDLRRRDAEIARNNRLGNRQTLEQALERLNEATREMSDAASAASRQQAAQGNQAQADARRAAERLNEAGDMLSRMRSQQTGSAVDDLARRASGLAKAEEEFMARMRQKFGGGAGAERSEEENRRLSDQMANEKQRLRDQLGALEHGMQQAARDMASTQPGASAKMRDAISTLQQDEVQSRMKRGEDMIRRGQASYAVMSEAMIVRSLNEVKDKLAEAQSAMSRTPQQEQNLEQALAQAEKMRQSMERLTGSGKQSGQERGQPQDASRQPGQQQARNGTPKPGQQPGEQHGAEPGSQPRDGQETGAQPGQESSQGQPSQQGRAGQQSTAGGSQPQGGTQGGSPHGGGDPFIEGSVGSGRDGQFRPMTQQDYQAMLDQLQQLRLAARDNRELTNSLGEIARDLRLIDPRHSPANPRMLQQIEAQILAKTEEVELMLRRKVDEKQGTAVRSAGPQPVPQGYGEAVAEYFRRLSKSR